MTGKETIRNSGSKVPGAVTEGNSKLLILAFFLLNLFSWVSYVEFKFGIPQIVKYVLSLGVLVIMVYYRLRHPKTPEPGSIVKPVLIIFLLWTLALLAWAVSSFNSIFYIQRLFGQKFFFIPYLLPLILLFSRFDLTFFRHYLNFAAIMIVPAIIMQIIVVAMGMNPSNWIEETGRIGIFDIGSWLLLLTAQLLKKKHITILVTVYYLIWLLLWSVYGRRGALVEYLVLLIFMVMMRLKSPLFNFHDRIKIYFAGIIVLLLLLVAGQVITSSYAFQRGISIEGFEESRGGFKYFFAEFDTLSEWLFGRGLDGTVIREINNEEGATGVIENGFLTVILKGGLLYLIPFLILLLRASYLGFYRSNNDLVKGLATLLLIHVLLMTYFNLPDYSTKYSLVWISVAVCYNPELRKLSNKDVYLALNPVVRKKADSKKTIRKPVSQS